MGPSGVTSEVMDDYARRQQIGQVSAIGNILN